MMVGDWSKLCAFDVCHAVITSVPCGELLFFVKRWVKNKKLFMLSYSLGVCINMTRSPDGRIILRVAIVFRVLIPD